MRISKKVLLPAVALLLSVVLAISFVICISKLNSSSRSSAEEQISTTLTNNTVRVSDSKPTKTLPIHKPEPKSETQFIIPTSVSGNKFNEQQFDNEIPEGSITIIERYARSNSNGWNIWQTRYEILVEDEKFTPTPSIISADFEIYHIDDKIDEDMTVTVYYFAKNRFSGGSSPVLPGEYISVTGNTTVVPQDGGAQKNENKTTFN